MSNSMSGGYTTGKYASERAVTESQRDSQSQNNGFDNSKSYHAVYRPWSAPAVQQTHNEQRPQADSRTSPMMQRWANESAKVQPWNGVAGYYTSSYGRK